MKTGRGRKSLSPSVRDNCRLCVKLVLRGIILEPRISFSPQNRRARLLWFSHSRFTCERVGLPIEYCKPRIGRTEFIALEEGKSEPFIRCIGLCQAPCLVLKTRRVKLKRDSSAQFKLCLPTPVSLPDWIPLYKKNSETCTWQRSWRRNSSWPSRRAIERVRSNCKKT